MLPHVAIIFVAGQLAAVVFLFVLRHSVASAYQRGPTESVTNCEVLMQSSRVNFWVGNSCAKLTLSGKLLGHYFIL